MPRLASPASLLPWVVCSVNKNLETGARPLRRRGVLPRWNKEEDQNIQRLQHIIHPNIQHAMGIGSGRGNTNQTRSNDSTVSPA
jgi:hypothetical protein